MTKKELTKVLAAVVPPRDDKDPEVIELEKWRKFEAYEIVEDAGQESIDGIWVINRKEEL